MTLRESLLNPEIVAYKSVEKVFASLTFIAAICGLAANLFLIAAVLRSYKLSPRSLLFLSLCWSQVLFVLPFLKMPYNLLHGGYAVPEWFCICESIISYLAVLTYLFSRSIDNVLLFMSAYRNDFVLTKNLAWKIIAGNWSFSLLISLIPIMSWMFEDSVVLRSSKIQCFVNFSSRAFGPMVYSLLLGLLIQTSFFIQLFVMKRIEAKYMQLSRAREAKNIANDGDSKAPESKPVPGTGAGLAKPVPGTGAGLAKPVYTEKEQAVFDRLKAVSLIVILFWIWYFANGMYEFFSGNATNQISDCIGTLLIVCGSTASHVILYPHDNRIRSCFLDLCADLGFIRNDRRAVNRSSSTPPGQASKPAGLRGVLRLEGLQGNTQAFKDTVKL